MCDQYWARTKIPPPELAIDCVCLHGLASTCNCKQVKEVILKLIKEWQDEEESELQSHRETVQVSPTHHPDIIGPGGVTVTKICKKHNVNIHSPQIDSLNPHQTLVVGRQPFAPTEEIPHIVEEAEDINVVAIIDYRVHSRLLGKKAGIVPKVMKEFKVVVTLPDRCQPCNRVVITGQI